MDSHLPDEILVVMAGKFRMLAERLHQGLDNGLIVKPMRLKVKRRGKAARKDEGIPPLSAIRCRTRLGGLLKHYEQRAA
jgi:hypothetical protein